MLPNQFFKGILSLSIPVIMLAACSSSKNSTGNRLPKFDKEGHRGCRALMPENTIPAMLHAIDLGVTTLEMDIAFSKDEVAVLSHEPFFNSDISTKPDGKPVTKAEAPKLNLYQVNFADISKYDVGLRPHPLFPLQQKIAVSKPSLSAVIDSVEAYIAVKKTKPVWYNIETKTTAATDNIYHPAPDVFVERLVKLINEKGVANRVIIQSFDKRTLIYLHAHYPAIKTSFLVEAEDRNSFRKQIKDLGFNPDIYSPEHTLITPELVQECHDSKIKIVPWTVNDKARIAELKALKVDGIITDNPELFK
jgi:glycerophosphoryl diester phosphodiesterase